MKKLYSLFAGLCLLAAVACNDDDLSVYDVSDCHLNFVFYDTDSTLLAVEKVTDQMRLRPFSFVLESTVEATRDTVWLDASTMGFLSDEARPLALQQIEVEGVKNAEPGVHYVAFDDPEVVSLYRVPGGKNRVSIPVIVLRNDPDLQDTTVVLKVGFKENGWFKAGYAGLDTRTIEITDHLSQPKNWYIKYSYASLSNYIGDYGEVKHRLMIEWTGKAWDADYVEEFMTGDANYMSYIASWLSKKLTEENDRRQHEGEDVYKEKNGTLVDFTSKWF